MHDSCTRSRCMRVRGRNILVMPAMPKLENMLQSGFWRRPAVAVSLKPRARDLGVGVRSEGAGKSRKRPEKSGLQAAPGACICAPAWMGGRYRHTARCSDCVGAVVTANQRASTAQGVVFYSGLRAIRGGRVAHMQNRMRHVFVCHLELAARS